MDHEDYIEAKKDVFSIFEEFFEDEGLNTTYGIAYIEYEDYLERGTFTSEKVYILFMMENVLQRTDAIHVNKKKNTLMDLHEVLDNPEKLELEEEDRIDFVTLAQTLLPIVENIPTHQDDSRA